MKDLFFSPAIKGGKISDKLIGKTKFELTNVKTGEVEKMEFKNTFTDGIESYFRDLGMFQNSPYGVSAVYQDNLWKDILGGILLFDTPLSTSPMAKYAPAGVTMVGNGAYGVSNSSNPPELGSYNALESSYTKDEIIMVYDFLTSQANGTIESVALTTFTGGFIGYGNKDGRTVGYTNYKEVYNRQESKAISGNRSANLDKAIYYNDHFYRPQLRSYTSGTTKITLDRSVAQTEKIDIFWFANSFSTDDTLEFTLTTPLSGEYFIEPIGGKYYPTHYCLVPNFTVAANSSFIFYLIDVATGTVTEKTITNNTGKTMKARCLFPVSDTKAILQTTDNYIYEIYITNSGVIGELGLWNIDIAGRMKFLTDELIAAGNSTSGYETIYDSVLNQTKYTNGYLTRDSASYYRTDYMYCNALDACFRHYENNGDRSQFQLFKCPLRLMTINNLSEAVTKTADKTMKVTYTITRAQS